MKIFTIYDSKAEAYLTPFFLKTNALAIREFETVSNQPESNFCKYPEDYTLFLLGEYSEETAIFTMEKTAVPLGKAIEFQHNQPMETSNEIDD